MKEIIIGAVFLLFCYALFGEDMDYSRDTGPVEEPEDDNDGIPIKVNGKWVDKK